MRMGCGEGHITTSQYGVLKYGARMYGFWCILTEELTTSNYCSVLHAKNNGAILPPRRNFTIIAATACNNCNETTAERIRGKFIYRRRHGNGDCRESWRHRPQYEVDGVDLLSLPDQHLVVSERLLAEQNDERCLERGRRRLEVGVGEHESTLLGVHFADVTSDVAVEQTRRQHEQLAVVVRHHRRHTPLDAVQQRHLAEYVAAVSITQQLPAFSEKFRQARITKMRK